MIETKVQYDDGKKKTERLKSLADDCSSTSQRDREYHFQAKDKLIAKHKQFQKD